MPSPKVINVMRLSEYAYIPDKDISIESLNLMKKVADLDDRFSKVDNITLHNVRMRTSNNTLTIDNSYLYNGYSCKSLILENFKTNVKITSECTSIQVYGKCSEYIVDEIIRSKQLTSIKLDIVDYNLDLSEHKNLTYFIVNHIYKKYRTNRKYKTILIKRRCGSVSVLYKAFK
jgi:hypothetical protein